MFARGAIGVLVIIGFAIKSVRLDDLSALQNEIMDSNYNGASGGMGNGNSVDQMNYGGNHMEINNKNQNIENLAEPPRQTWFDTARNALSGPAGQIVVHMAKEMISRSTGNSQILSLNLTNLLILILLKALIFAAGLIGAGNWGGQYGRARAMDTPFLLPEEGPLFIGYLALEGSGQDGCLNQAACKAPDTAQEYLKAAMAVIKGTEMFDKNYMNTTKKNYAYTLNQLEHSIQRGIEGAACDSIYHCHL